MADSEIDVAFASNNVFSVVKIKCDLVHITDDESLDFQRPRAPEVALALVFPLTASGARARGVAARVPPMFRIMAIRHTRLDRDTPHASERATSICDVRSRCVNCREVVNAHGGSPFQSILAAHMDARTATLRSLKDHRVGQPFGLNFDCMGRHGTASRC